MRTETNKLIADFMGKEWHKSFFSDVFIISPSNITYKFDTDWNWLMEVVEKIEFLDDGKFDVNLLKNGTQIFEYQAGGKVIVNNVGEISFDNKIEHVYQAVVEFIKWYNHEN